MIKQFLNSLILVCFLTVFSVDSISSIFELDNTITCELTDGNDSEDQSEEDGEFEKETFISEISFIEPQTQLSSAPHSAHLYFLSDIHSFSIPTPPPELIF